jgi:hypothetical protein
MLKLSRKFMDQNFATIVGVLIVLAVFGLAIGLALFVQNGESVKQIWPFQYFTR